jgi:hypothetical protein
MIYTNIIPLISLNKVLLISARKSKAFTQVESSSYLVLIWRVLDAVVVMDIIRWSVIHPYSYPYPSLPIPPPLTLSPS